MSWAKSYMANEQILFEEKQYFRQFWVWLLLGAIILLFLWAFVQQIILGVPWGNNPASDGMLIALGIIFGLALPLFILTSHLSVVVRQDILLVRFFPIHLKQRAFAKDSIISHRAISYSPLRDFGGWGIRYGSMGKAYNVSGNRGVLLKLKDGNSLLIGSQRAEELDAAIALMISLDGVNVHQ